MEFNISYVPPIKHFPGAAASRLLSEDAASWTLAYLSHDWDRCGMVGDAQFTVNVRRTMQFVLATGHIDLGNVVPDNVKVAGLLKHPPPRAVKLLLDCDRLVQMPMFKAYGQQWPITMFERSKLWRAPHDPVFDAAVVNLAEALAVIQKVR